MSNGGRFRSKRVYFTQVSNSLIRDDKISLKAKGLYSLIQSYITIEDFVLYKDFLRSQCKEGRDSFQGAWDELKKNGYLMQYKIKDENGKFNYEYDLLDEPIIKEVVNNTKPKKPKKTKVKNEKNLPHTEKPIMELPHTGFPHTDFPDTGFPGTENRGYINNTNLNNTNLNNTDLNHTDGKLVFNIDLIESNTHLKLTDNMKNKVLSWDKNRLEKSIDIFKNNEGKYFSLLEKIYKDDNNFKDNDNKYNYNVSNYTSNNSKRNNSNHMVVDPNKYKEVEEAFEDWLDNVN